MRKFIISCFGAIVIALRAAELGAPSILAVTCGVGFGALAWYVMPIVKDELLPKEEEEKEPRRRRCSTYSRQGYRYSLSMMGETDKFAERAAKVPEKTPIKIFTGDMSLRLGDSTGITMTDVLGKRG